MADVGFSRLVWKCFFLDQEALGHGTLLAPWPGWSCVLELEEKRPDGSCLCIDEGFHPIEVVRKLLAAQLTEYFIFRSKWRRAKLSRGDFIDELTSV